jgi:hypothetical protein
MKGVIQMTLLQEQAIALVRRMPDEQLFHLVSMLKNMEALLSSLRKSDPLSPSMNAYNELQKYRRPSSIERDYKGELAAIREERYATPH